MVQDYFSKINGRLKFLENTVLKQVGQKTEIVEMEKSV